MTDPAFRKPLPSLLERASQLKQCSTIDPRVLHPLRCRAWGISPRWDLVKDDVAHTPVGTYLAGPCDASNHINVL